MAELPTFATSKSNHGTLPAGFLVEELRAFADETGELYSDGIPQDYYTPKWDQYLAKGSRLKFNWAACIFGMNWCFWRRQYALGLGVFVAELACSFIMVIGYGIGRGTIRTDDWVPGLLAYAALPIVRVPLGLAANRYYLSRAKSAIAKARNFPTREGQMKRISRAGGTSFLGLAAGIVITLVVTIWSRWPAA